MTTMAITSSSSSVSPSAPSSTTSPSPTPPSRTGGIFDTLPDHPFYQNANLSDQAGPPPPPPPRPQRRTASLSSTHSAHLAGVARRKQPPKWTESLENLASSISISISSSPGKSTTPDMLGFDHQQQQQQHDNDGAMRTRAMSTPMHQAGSGSQHKSKPRAAPFLGGTFGVPAPANTPRKSLPLPLTSLFYRPPTDDLPLPLSPRGSSASTLPSLSCGSASTPSTTSCGLPPSVCGDPLASWSILEEVLPADKASKESRKARKARKRAEEAAFDENRVPGSRELLEASLMEVVDERGQEVKFGDLVRGRRTIVIFIRHWLCPLCAQYVASIVSTVTPASLAASNVSLVIIGNGAWRMLASYRTFFSCPFPIYTDPSLALYRALGLTRQTGDAGPSDLKGDYLVQSGMQATVTTLKRAAAMPLRNPGHFLQLGGEFVFEGTLNVSWVNRMGTTRGHRGIREVCGRAGVRLEWIDFEPGEGPPEVHREEVVGEESDAHRPEWKQDRERVLESIREGRRKRREWSHSPGLDTELGEVVVVGADEGAEELAGEEAW